MTNRIISALFFVAWLLVVVGSITYSRWAYPAEPQAGQTFMYRGFCSSLEALRKALEAKTLHPGTPGCAFLRRPWPARILNAESGSYSSPDGKEVRIWHAIDLPPPHDEVWIPAYTGRPAEPEPEGEPSGWREMQRACIIAQARAKVHMRSAAVEPPKALCL